MYIYMRNLMKTVGRCVRGWRSDRLGASLIVKDGGAGKP
jgi:hypothetical protein